jgi:hypothetical protein
MKRQNDFWFFQWIALHRDDGCFSLSLVFQQTVSDLINFALATKQNMRASYCLALVSIWTTFAYGYSSRLLPLRTQQLQRSSSAAVVDTNKLLSQPSTTSTIGTRTMSLNTIARGGGASAQQPKCPVTGPATVLSSVWGAGGVVYILARAIARVWPIAIEPFQAGAVPLTQVQLS